MDSFQHHLFGAGSEPRSDRSSAGLVRVTALPLLPAMKEAPSHWLDLCFRVLASSCCVKNDFSNF